VFSVVALAPLSATNECAFTLVLSVVALAPLSANIECALFYVVRITIVDDLFER
jgi:hypothetical protein